MSSQIGNQALLRSIGEALGIESVKQAPSRLNVAEIVVALQLHSGFANYERWAIPNVAPAEINGLSGFDISLVAQDPFYSSFPQFQVNSQGREMVILGYRLDIDYDAAGAAADTGNYMAISTGFWDPELGMGTNAGQLETWAQVAATRLNYSFTFPFWGKQHSSSFTGISHANNRVWVPAGCEYNLHVTRSGGAWPNNTTLAMRCFGVSVPKGICPPLCG